MELVNNTKELSRDCPEMWNLQEMSPEKNTEEFSWDCPSMWNLQGEPFEYNT